MARGMGANVNEVSRAHLAWSFRALASAGTLRNVLDLSSHTNTQMQHAAQAPREESARMEDGVQNGFSGEWSF